VQEREASLESHGIDFKRDSTAVNLFKLNLTIRERLQQFTGPQNANPASTNVSATTRFPSVCPVPTEPSTGAGTPIARTVTILTVDEGSLDTSSDNAPAASAPSMQHSKLSAKSNL
jgi:hypothetical protein